MEKEMVVKNGGGLEKESPDINSKNTGKHSDRRNVTGRRESRNGKEVGPDSSGRGRGRAHGYHRGNHRQHKKQQKAGGSNRDAAGILDLDVSLQEELMHGNYRLRGRKAQVSINHLLQFQLPEIEREQDDQHRKNLRRRTGADQHIHLHGDSFINANYRLLVDDCSDYKEQTNDPNVPVPQEKIVRVIVPKGQNCPICLTEDPVAPQMVACGHIFCLNCILNFFSVEDATKEKSTYAQRKNLKECPLCGSIVRPNKVKPVLIEEMRSGEAPQAGEEATLKLMCKPHGSILPLPVQLGIDPMIVGDSPSLDSPVADYAHIIKCSTRHAIELYQKDLDAINTQYEIDKILYNESGKYYKMAIEEVNTRIAQAADQQKIHDDSLQLGRSMEAMNLGIELKKKYDDSNAFFFYQTSFHSSTRFFLSPLDVKVLLSAFRHYSEFPEELNVLVENVDYGSGLTAEMVNRYKYFGHLPLGTVIAFIEIDWRENSVLPKEVYQQFIVELKQRRRKLSIKKQKEDKQKVNYQRRLEREHAEFYQRENGETFSDRENIGQYVNLRDDGLDSLFAVEGTSQGAGANEEQEKRSSFRERTIWGTSIPVIPDEKSTKENEEFEAMLLQKMQQDEDPSEESLGTASKGKRKKKKGKVMLFSSAHRTL